MLHTITLESPVFNSFRVQQVAGLFDVPIAEKVREEFSVEVPEEVHRDGKVVESLRDSQSRLGETRPRSWQLGLVVGPSGSGKTTLARRLFGDRFIERMDWPTDRAIVDCFDDLPIRRITGLLTAVGFSSPPSWIKPYHVLSGGERFRCDLARALAGRMGATAGLSSSECGVRLHAAKNTDMNAGLLARSNEVSNLVGHSTAGQASSGTQITTPLVAFDEFTSVVDRNVARIGSAAVARAIRRSQIRCRFVAVTCHYDIVEWLCPDWIIDMATREFAWVEQGAGDRSQGAENFTALSAPCNRRLLRRPPIELCLYRCHHAAWPVFARHHYLSGSLSRAARCFVAVWDGGAKGSKSHRVEKSKSDADGVAVATAGSLTLRLLDSSTLLAAIPVAFCATLPVVGRKNHWRISRIVTLPDYQGIGIGMRVVEAVADMHRAQGHRINVTASHPALIAHCRRSPKWRCVNLQKTGSRPQRGIPGYRGSAGRAVVSFEYEGAVGRG